MALDDGMPDVDGDELVAGVHHRLGVVLGGCRLGERREDVERSQPPSGLLNPRRLGGDAGAQPLEDRDLELETALVGAEDLLFVLLERRRDEPLAAGDRLLAVVVGRNVAEVRLRDLDVVAEDAVVANLERRNAGPRPLRVFHRGDVLLVRAADAAQVVELGVDAVADHAAVARDRRRLVDERRVELVAEVGEIVELGDEAPDERRLQLGEEHAHARHGGNRLSQRDEVARPGDAERRARDEPLDVVNRLERLAQLGAFGRAERQLLDGVEPILNPLERDERPEQPRAQQPAAHRRHRAVDLVQQRSGAPAVGGVDHLEVAQRRRIDEQAVGAGAERDLTDVGEIGLLRVAQVVDERAGRAHRRGPILEAEPEQALRRAADRAAFAAPTPDRRSSRRRRSRAHVLRTSATSAAASVESLRARQSRAAGGSPARRPAPGVHRRRDTPPS